jgi:hypothetical protein
VTSTGVYAIDAKMYAGRPRLRIEGGLFRPRVEKLLVGTRDCTKLVRSMRSIAAWPRCYQPPDASYAGESTII